MFKSLTKMINALRRLITIKEKYSYQTFTYFVPAPPERRTGYREKNFDKVVYELINDKGYEVVSIHTTPNQNSGMWVILKLRSRKANSKLDLEYPQMLSESENDVREVSQKIEGLYYLD